MKIMKSVCMAAVIASGFFVAPALAMNEREAVNVVAPEYPRGAERRNLEGEVSVRYNVTPEGTVSDVEIVEATPAGVFDRAVLRALEQWQYAPAEETTEGVEQVFNFAFAG
ncbi:MAG TPA: energy transducer TonB [Oceanicaulis sp.]|nr:energy transducer TonB [Oceanicaulis sp.]